MDRGNERDKKIVWSPYQRAIFEHIKLNKDNLFISARAGSSKTTSLVEGIKYIPKKNSILVVAFNKIIAKELKGKLGSYVVVSTLHSLGYAALRNDSRFKGIKLDKYKMFKIVQERMNDKTKKSGSVIAFTLETCRALSLAKGYLIDTPEQVDELLDKFNVNAFLEREEYIRFILDCLSDCKKQMDTIDYDDMIYFPFIFHLDVGKYDNVIVDEAQDLNLPQLHMAVSACKQKGKMAFFYDEFQDLYSWRASNVPALKKLQEKLKGISLLLPISYRCDKSIIKLAQTIVPDIQHRADAGPGWVVDYPEANLFKVVKAGDFVLSRTNAPIIKYALYCLRNNISAHIQGKNLSEPIINLINKSKHKTVKEFLPWLKSWEETEVHRLTKKNRSVEPVLDMVESLHFLCEDLSSMEDVKKRTKAVCETKEDNHQITFSTIHGAKGLERRRAFLIMRTFKMGKNQEEKNIFYTAITRAKEELYLLR